MTELQSKGKPLDTDEVTLIVRIDSYDYGKSDGTTELKIRGSKHDIGVLSTYFTNNSCRTHSFKIEGSDQLVKPETFKEWTLKLPPRPSS